ncbi:MAG: 4-demethylwyosine synthase TYW1 [archaeon]
MTSKTKQDYIKALKHQNYKVIGENQHSAVKTCHWTKESIKCGENCYKQDFYGIDSHRCLQMTPNIYCNQKCIFCWRSWEESPQGYLPNKWDEPEEIIEESIKAQEKLLSGLGGIPDRIDKEKYEEAYKPTQVAISLLGEPTLYPHLPELIEKYKEKEMTTFVVSNGMNSEMIKKINPTQLYLSLDAPTKEKHLKVNCPQVENSWEKLQKSLSYLKEKNRSTIRITAIKGINMEEPEKYAEIINKNEVDFVEIKAYMYIGYSRKRLEHENMPSHKEVKRFTKRINKYLDYNLIDEKPLSRVTLLSSGKKDKKIKKV